MKPRVIHFVFSFYRHGLSEGIINLIRTGFYDEVDPYFVQVVPGKDSPIADEIAKLVGHDRVITLFENGLSKQPRFNSTVIKLRNVCSRIKPQTVICSTFITEEIAASIGDHVKLIQFQHFDMAATPRLRSILRKFTPSRINSFFGDSTLVTKRARPHDASHKPAHTVWMTAIVPQNRIVEKSPETINILSLGSLDSRKRCKQLVEAAVHLKERRQNFKLTIAGKGPMKGELERLIKEHNLSDYVELPGYVVGDEKKELFRKAHVYVQPSENEGSGIAAMEALAAGIPVIVTSWARGNWANEKNVIFTGGTSDAIAKTLHEFILNYDKQAPLALADADREDKTVAQAYSDNGVRTARNTFSIRATKQNRRAARIAIKQHIVPNRPKSQKAAASKPNPRA